jgi:hypothetical protein
MANFSTEGMKRFSENLKQTSFEEIFDLISEFRIKNMVVDSFSMLDISLCLIICALQRLLFIFQDDCSL